MRIEFVEAGNEVSFELHDVDPSLDSVLEHCFWHARIDVASDPSERLDDPEPVDCGPFARGHLETVHYRGHDIQVPPLYLQVAANRRRGRKARAELLEKRLNMTP
jgi:hypothetical protein